MDTETIFQVMKEEELPHIPKHHSFKTEFFSQRPLQVSELHDLFMKTKFKDKPFIFYKSLLYLDIISFEAQRNPKINLNHELLVLNSFLLGIKFTQNQINVPRISQLKESNKKYSKYNNETILVNEILCVKLLKFKMAYSTTYDFLMIFLHEKEQLFEKAKEYLEKIAFNQVYVCFSSYSIACAIITFTLSILRRRDPLLKKFCINKEGSSYKMITNIIISNKEYSNTSTSPSEGSPSNEKKVINFELNKDAVVEKYKKMRQMSKNIELSNTNQFYQMNMSLMTSNDKEDKDINKGKLIPKEKETVEKYSYIKESNIKSSINIFSPINRTKHECKNSGTINLYNPTIENSRIQPSNVNHTISAKKTNFKINIDIHSLSKFKLNPTSRLNYQNYQ